VNDYTYTQQTISDLEIRKRIITAEVDRIDAAIETINSLTVTVRMKPAPEPPKPEPVAARATKQAKVKAPKAGAAKDAKPAVGSSNLELHVPPMSNACPVPGCLAPAAQRLLGHAYGVDDTCTTSPHTSS
jgi:hypothetical protein